MSTIGGLLLPSFAPFDYGRQFNQGIEGGRGIVQGQTALLALEEAKRQQEAIARYEQFVREHPESILGNLQQAPGGPPGMPPTPGMTQQTFAPGMPPGAPQGVPGGQDLSRFAGVSPQGGGPMPQSIINQLTPQVTPPPQSVLGGLGGQPGQPPAPPTQQSQLMDLMRQDPRAALLVQQQMQGQQDRQFKMEGQSLERGVKKMEYFGQLLLGVNSPESYADAVREVARIDPQAAARFPQTYSKEALQPLIDQAQTVKDTMLQRLDARKLDVLTRGQDVELAKAQQTGGKVNYQTDAQGNIVVVPEYAPGGGPVQSRPVLGADGQPIKSLEGQKLTAEQQRHIQTVEGGLRTHVDTLLAPLYSARDAIGRIEQSATNPSTAGDLALITAFMQMIDPRTGVKDAEFRNAASGGGILDRVQGYIGNLMKGTRLDEDVRADFLQRARMLYEQYDKDYGQVKQQYRDLTARMGGNPENVVLDKGSTAAQKPQDSGAPAAGNTFTDKDIAATMANPRNKGKTRQQIIDDALAKGLTYKER